MIKIFFKVIILGFTLALACPCVMFTAFLLQQICLEAYSIIKAARDGHLDKVQRLIEQGFNVNVLDAQGNSPLYSALTKGHIEIARLLIEKGADVKVSDKPLLWHALTKGHIEIAQLLIEKGADVNASNNSDKPPLWQALEQGHIEIARLLIEKGADLNTLNWVGRSLLCNNLKLGHVELVRFLLEKGADPNIADNMGNSFLFCAFEEGHIETTRLLIEKGADPNTFNMWGESVLGLAVKRADIAITGLLLEKGANPNIADKENNSLLSWALKEGNIEIAQLMLEKGADPNSFNKLRESALVLAVKRANIPITRLLLEKGADPNATDMWNGSVLGLAVKRADIPIIRLLLEKGANPNIADKENNSPLFWAFKEGHIEIVQLMLEKGADLQSLEQHNIYPLHHAVKNYNIRLVQLLLEKGADVNALNENGHSPLYQAVKNEVKNCDIQIVQLLLEKGANTDSLHDRSDSPLYQLAFYGNSEVMRILLKKGVQINFLHLFDENTPHGPFFYNMYGHFQPIYKIPLYKINIFIELLLWYSYQTSTSLVNNRETPFSQSPLSQAIRNLIGLMEKWNVNILPADQAKYFEQAKSLTTWIILQTFNSQSTKEFLEKILKYLLNPNCEERNLLRENVKHLLLNQYLLNANSLDFYQLKSKFSSAQLENLKDLENFLRYTYAKQLKKELFNDMSQEDLENQFNTLNKKDSNLTFLSQINDLMKINNPVMKYCRDNLIELSFKNRVLKIDKANRTTELIAWIQRIHNTECASSTKEDLPKKQPSAKEIWGNWGKSYIEDSKRLITSIYNHLEHIIQHQGTQLNSNTPFGSKYRIDILKFEK